MVQKKGKLIILSGPSGVGKGTICHILLKNPKLKLVYSISMTTRTRRENEVEGISYFFVTPEQFQQAIKNNELLEYAQFVGNYYGTPKKYVEKMLNLGKNIILEIEVEGATQVLEKMKDCISIFLIPPSLAELKKRLIERQSEPIEIINQRLIKAEREMQLKDNYHYVIVNDELNRVVDELTTILFKEIN